MRFTVDHDCIANIVNIVNMVNMVNIVNMVGKHGTFEQDCIVNMVFTFPRENLWPSTVHIDMAQLSGEYL